MSVDSSQSQLDRKLALDQTVIDALLGEQAGVGSQLNQRTIVQHSNAICALDGAQPMRDNNNGSISGIPNKNTPWVRNLRMWDQSKISADFWTYVKF